MHLDDVVGSVYVHSPEDLIINKIHYYAIGRQTKHVRDIASILANPSIRLDWQYLDKWLDALELRPVWDLLKSEIDRNRRH